MSCIQQHLEICKCGQFLYRQASQQAKHGLSLINEETYKASCFGQGHSVYKARKCCTGFTLRLQGKREKSQDLDNTSGKTSPLIYLIQMLKQGKRLPQIFCPGEAAPLC